MCLFLSRGMLQYVRNGTFRRILNIAKSDDVCLCCVLNASLYNINIITYLSLRTTANAFYDLQVVDFYKWSTSNKKKETFWSFLHQKGLKIVQ